ncbi:MAG: hypothetical protein AMXMBFR61_06530 [Fimbriimonadales bacterium]
MRIARILIGVAIAVVVSVGAHAPVLKIQRPTALTAAATITHPPINEQSGIVKSRTYDDVYWVHNDSGDEARIFAIRSDGSVIMPSWVGDRYYADQPAEGKEPYPGIRLDAAHNLDWEDIAIEGDTLYIGDVGNNGNARRDLGVYVLKEPNPRATMRTRVLKWLPVAYADQKEYPGDRWHFDCEALFVHKGKLHFLTKHRAGATGDLPENGTKLYRLDTEFTDRVNVLTLLDSKQDLGGWVTAADISPDEKHLAVLTQFPVASVWLFELPAQGDKLLSGNARRFVFSGGKQCEGVCFVDDRTLLVTNEQREIFRLSLDGFSPAVAK